MARAGALKALAERAAAGESKTSRSTTSRPQGGAETILRYELMDRIRPHCMFLSGTERALIKRGDEDGGRKVVEYVPTTSIRRLAC